MSLPVSDSLADLDSLSVLVAASDPVAASDTARPVAGVAASDADAESVADRVNDTADLAAASDPVAESVAVREKALVCQ